MKNSTPKHNVLDVSVDIYTDCGYCDKKKKQPTKLNVPYSIYAEWLWHLSRMGNLEFGAVFTAEKEGNEYVITSCTYPKQTVSSGECQFLEEVASNGIMHSHHTMGAYHSGQDDAHCRNLYDFSIVISTTGLVASHRIKLPCGGLGYKKADVIILDAPEELPIVTPEVKTDYTSFEIGSLSESKKDKLVTAWMTKVYDFFRHCEDIAEFCQYCDRDTVTTCRNCSPRILYTGDY